MWRNATLAAAVCVLALTLSPPVLAGAPKPPPPPPPPPTPPANPVIAYVANRVVKGLGYSDLMVMNADGTNKTVVVSTQTWSGGIGITNPCWSPDLDPAAPGWQGAIAFSASANGWVVDVRVVNGAVVAGTPRSIDAPAGTFSGVGYSAWSPYAGGPWIADYGNMTSANNEPCIALLPALGTDHTPVEVVNQLASLSEGIWQPAWSPDGTTLAFMRCDTHMNQVSLRTKRVLDDTGAPSAGYPELTLIDFADGFTYPGNSAYGPDWSRSGQWIAFHGSGPSYPDAIYAISPDGTGLHAIPGTSGAESPSWAPDDSSLVYSQGGQVVKQDLTTGATTVLAIPSAKGSCRWPDWRRVP